MLKIHRWVAIPFGVFISVLCFTGAIMVFKKEVIVFLKSMGCEGSAFFKTIIKMHGSFLIPGNGTVDFGEILVGLSAIAMSIILITGLILWWPKKLSSLKSRLSVHFNKGLKHFIYDSHVSLGFYSFIFLLMMSATGPSWSFKWYNKASGSIVSATLEDTGDAKSNRAAEQKTLFSLHSGKWGGMPVRVIYCATALIGGFLPLSGYYMWASRLKRRKRKNQKKNTN